MLHLLSSAPLKNFCEEFGKVILWILLNMECAENAAIRSPIGALELLGTNDIKVQTYTI